jgi:hypothetical protein
MGLVFHLVIPLRKLRGALRGALREALGEATLVVSSGVVRMCCVRVV